MIKNMCGLDRGLRLLLSIVLLGVAFLVPAIASNTLLSILVASFGLVNAMSAILSFCPVYLVAGISSLRSSFDSNEPGSKGSDAGGDR